MDAIRFHLIHPGDQSIILQIAEWYFSEWQIPVKCTMKHFIDLNKIPGQFHVLMMIGGRPVATGGIYNHVGLIDKAPQFNMYKKWLARVYTMPSKRGRGYATLLCNYIQQRCLELGFKQMHLFTHTAEPLYHKLGWKAIERLTLNNKNIVVMEQNLNGGTAYDNNSINN